jgi:hypothetical protein
MTKKNKIVGLNLPKKQNSEESSETETFDYDATTYLAVMNPETGRYDMLTIRIDLLNDTAMVERTATRYDSPHRALQDTVAQVSREMMNTKTQKERK